MLKKQIYKKACLESFIIQMQIIQKPIIQSKFWKLY